MATNLKGAIYEIVRQRKKTVDPRVESPALQGCDLQAILKAKGFDVDAAAIRHAADQLLAENHVALNALPGGEDLDFQIGLSWNDTGTR